MQKKESFSFGKFETKTKSLDRGGWGSKVREDTQRAHRWHTEGEIGGSFEFSYLKKNRFLIFFKRVLEHFGAIFEPLDPGPTFFTQILVHFVDSRPESYRFAHFSKNVDFFDNFFSF